MRIKLYIERSWWVAEICGVVVPLSYCALVGGEDVRRLVQEKNPCACVELGITC